MNTLLQTLLIETLPADQSILRAFIEKVLPSIEREFALVPALGGDEEIHYQTLSQSGDRYAREKAQRWANDADQSLMVHILNGLLTAWKLANYLSKPLSEIEKHLLCLGFTLHDYNKWINNQGIKAPGSHQVPEIVDLCNELGKKLNFQSFWPDWEQYISEICYLAQNTQGKVGRNAVSSNWQTFKIDERRLDSPLGWLMRFGDVAVHLTDPTGIVTNTEGQRLQEHLRKLQIPKKLVYHRLRDCRGLLTNGIHNAVVLRARQLGWEPILFFAQGAIYLAPQDNETPELEDLQEFIWQQISALLSREMLGGNIGFKRDGKGLKVAPQTLELFSPAELIRQLPDVVKVRVANVNTPATPKRLEKLTLSDAERKRLEKVADIRADRLAEFFILTQREFFEGCAEYAPWILKALELEEQLSPEQTQLQSGGVNYGWYHAAACYLANPNRSSWNPEKVAQELSELANQLAVWAEAKELLRTHTIPTCEAVFGYLTQYLEVSGWGDKVYNFQGELAVYIEAKVTNQPICSLSSGEFAAEDQFDSVVLFKPQQYSNKNALGGGRIKRGISKIWSLEMLLRQALWAAPAGKLEEQQPVFLYIFPAYVYSPETIAAVKLLVNDLQSLRLWEVHQHWLNVGMDCSKLQNLPWRVKEEAEKGRFGNRYSGRDLPFMATTYTTTKGKTVTEAWIEPVFLALTLPIFLGVKVVTAASPEPLYSSDSEFRESVILDGVARFWNLLELPTSIRLQKVPKALEELFTADSNSAAWRGIKNTLPYALDRLFIAYGLHLENRGSRTDPRWQGFNGTVREIATDVLNIFVLANGGLRRNKRDRPTSEEVKRYWKYAQLWARGDQRMDGAISLIEQLVDEYRRFYRVNASESSHAILLPLSIAIDNILSIPNQVELKDVILEGAGQIQKALARREVYRPLLMSKATGLDYHTRLAQEFSAIKTFMTTCVEKLFLETYKKDRALLQENRNRIKAGAEFAYRWLALQERQIKPETPISEDSQSKGEVA